MKRHHQSVFFSLMLLAPMVLATEPRVIQVLQDFEANCNIKNKPGSAIQVSQSTQTVVGASCLRVSIPKGFDWSGKGWSGNQSQPMESALLSVLASPFLPPEADAVRMRVKVASGRAIITVGSPVSQMGNSDVFCDPQWVDADKDHEWKNVVISLNHRLIRNYRRPNFTRDLPVIYYTRWAQEPLMLYLLSLPEPLRPNEETVLFIDQIELLATGEGHPFLSFADSMIVTTSVIADFESTQDMSRVCSVGHGYSIVKSFESGYRRQADARKPDPYPAPQFSLVAGRDGKKALQAECVWAEEGQIVTVKTSGDTKANAVRFTLKPDYSTKSRTGVAEFAWNGSKASSVDFIIFVSPKGSDFPWHDLEANGELKQAFKASGYTGPENRYDYLLTAEKNTCVTVPDIRQAGSFGFYFARRHMKAGTWSSVTIPFSDFICVYGQGACKPLQLQQRSLAPETIAAIGILAPFGSGHGTLSLDDITYVHVPDAPEELHSFWQVPDVSKAKLIPLPRFCRYGISTMMTLDENVPDYLK
jgi:hypothetical protein